MPLSEESRLIDMWAEMQTHKDPPQTAPVEPVVSMDLLRVVCEPFFEQILTAMQQALAAPQKQQQNGCPVDPPIMQAMAQAKVLFEQMLTALPQALELTPKEQPNTCAKTVPAFQHTFQRLQPKTADQHPMRASFPTPDQHPMRTKLSTKAAAFQPFQPREAKDALHTNHYHDGFDLESTEAADSIDGDSMMRSESDSATPYTTLVAPDHTPKQSPDKNSMVCRHWRSKGWCRLEESGGCMFAHPEHKRGVAAPIAPHVLCTDDDKTSSVLPGLAAAVNTQGKEGATKRKKHRAGKKNRDKEVVSEQLI